MGMYAESCFRTWTCQRKYLLTILNSQMRTISCTRVLCWIIECLCASLPVMLYRDEVWCWRWCLFLRTVCKRYSGAFVCLERRWLSMRRQGQWVRLIVMDGVIYGGLGNSGVVCREACTISSPSLQSWWKVQSVNNAAILFRLAKKMRGPWLISACQRDAAYFQLNWHGRAAYSLRNIFF